MAQFPQLTEEDFHQFNAVLRDLLAQSEATFAIIVEKAGYLIHQFGEVGEVDTTQLATLAANAFNATEFMTQIIKEPRFTGMYQQGEHHSTLMINVDEHCLLVTVFPADISAGAVRYFAEFTTRDIATQIQRAHERAPGNTFDLVTLNPADVGNLFHKKQG